MNYLSRIRDVIEDSDISKKEIATFIGKDYSNLTKILREDTKDKRYFNVEDIIKICIVTKTDPNYLLGFSENRNNYINEDVYNDLKNKYLPNFKL